MTKKEFKTVTRNVKVRNENGEYVRNTNGKFVYETKVTEYRIDADYIPSKIDDICFDFICNYVDANDEGDWFDDLLSKKEIIKNGKNKGNEMEISFVSIRSAFANKFFPEIIKGSSKKVSMRERWLAKRRCA